MDMPAHLNEIVYGEGRTAIVEGAFPVRAIGGRTSGRNLNAASEDSFGPSSQVKAMAIHTLNPLSDTRWDDLVGRHSNASAFHQRAWLEALTRTYGYKPVAFTTSSPTAELKNAIVFCQVDSWLTGSRLVSLPFSDHCEPLCDSVEEMTSLIGHSRAVLERQGLRYLEVRPINGIFGQLAEEAGFLRGAKYFLHTLDLRPNLEEVFRKLDKDSVQRRIHHAERSGLTDKCGTSEELLKEFYRLFTITRDRHQLPPTPYAWFRNLIQSHGNSLEIRVAYKDESPAAAILTLRFRDVLYYKYGSSDVRLNKLGATPWLLWRAVSAAKLSGANEFDMGRTEEGNAGLLAFKNHWVPVPKQLVYWNYPKVSVVGSVEGWKVKMAKHVFSIMPRRLMAFTGTLIYRHIG